MTPLQRQVRAQYDDETITVYQAYSPAIADAVLAAGRFVTPFKLERMTWIKPSFLWMMYRCGWATKPGQERVLAIRLTRDGFEHALSQACLSHFDPAIYRSWEEWQEIKRESPVRIQWDPERDVHLQPLPWRSIQIGLGGTAARDYVARWTIDITDITATVHELRDETSRCLASMPSEDPYPVPDQIAHRIGLTNVALA